MKENIAKFFSFIFHPLLLPTFAVAILFFFPSYMSHYQVVYKKYVVLIVFLSTFISPLLVMLILLNLKIVSNLFLPERKERFYPLAIVTFIYVSAYVIIIRLPLGVPDLISNFILISSFILFISFLINIKIKISAHMAGIGGFLGFFFIFFLKENISVILFAFFEINFYSTHFFSIIIIIAGIIATSRLTLKAHNNKEISFGFFTGLIIGLLSMFLI